MWLDSRECLLGTHEMGLTSEPCTTTGIDKNFSPAKNSSPMRLCSPNFALSQHRHGKFFLGYARIVN